MCAHDFFFKEVLCCILTTATMTNGLLVSSSTVYVFDAVFMWDVLAISYRQFPDRGSIIIFEIFCCMMHIDTVLVGNVLKPNIDFVKIQLRC